MDIIEKLTPEQEAKIPIYLKKYNDKVYNSQPIDKIKCEDSITYIYQQAGYKKPYIWYVESPLMAQIIGNILTNKNNINLWDNLRDNLGDNLRDNLGDNLWANLGANLWDNLGDNLWANLGANLWDNLGANLRDNLRDNLGDNLGANLGANLRANLRDNLWANLWDNLGDNLWANLRDNLRDNLGDNLGDNLENKINHITPSYYGNISDYGWTCLYDFINNELIPSYNYELWNKWKQLIDSNIYDMIQLDGLCIVMSMPSIISIDEQKRLHNESDCAISWKDGYRLYAWHGLIIPESWIINKESITREIFVSEKNAEKRRCLKEILGNNRLIELLDVEIIDSDIDSFNYPIKLYRTKTKDELINDYIYFLNVIDPSTTREYYLCVPEHKNVWEAKSWTFQHQKIEIRHGDVGLLNIAKKFNNPILES